MIQKDESFPCTDVELTLSICNSVRHLPPEEALSILVAAFFFWSSENKIPEIQMIRILDGLKDQYRKHLIVSEIMSKLRGEND